MPENQRKVGFAVLLMLGATLCFAALDATSKHLAQTYPIPMMVWGRYAFHCLMMLIFLAPAVASVLLAARSDARPPFLTPPLPTRRLLLAAGSPR